MTPISTTHHTPSPTWLLIAAALCLGLAATTTATAREVAVELQADGLQNLGTGWAYEGWLIVDGSPVSSGTFTVSDSGIPSRSLFAVDVADDAAIAAFVLTIEPVPDADPAPSAVHMLGGDFQGGTAELSAGHAAALGDDFTAAAGSYILAAPSGGDGSDYHNGIWWLDPAGAPDPTLDLPQLPDGWMYEGWVVGPGGPMSTGRFTMPSGEDSDGGGLTAGPNGTPAFPGQDLINPPSDLTSGFAAVITIEPEPDNSPNPFTFKPLVDAEIDDVGGGTLQGMDNMASVFPTATITLSDSMVTSETAQLRLDFAGIEDLGPDYVYEGWLIVDGEPVSTGRFTVDGGVPSETYFPTEVSSLDAISAFVLTIEPAQNDDPAPSSVHLLGGDFIDGTAVLSIDHMAALGTDFENAAGSYILAAPSSGGSVPYTNGIWWLDPAGAPDPTLELPELPAGWIYEGWVAGPDGPISTGRFRMPAGADSDGGGPAAGSEPTPAFPGQDFVDPPIDLVTGYAAVISVEPEPDNSPSPFTIKPLLDRVIDDVGMATLQPMGFNPSSIPSGRAALMGEQYIAAAAHTPGINQTVWRTDLDLHNAGPQTEPVVIELLRSDQANQTPMRQTIMLAPSESIRYSDVFASLFDTEGVGALRIVGDMDSLVIASRTYNDEGAGSYGQGIPAEGRADALGFGDVGRLVGLSQSGDLSSGFRTNIGLVNLGIDPVTVQIDLYWGFVNLGRVTRTLSAFEQTQINGIFPESAEVGHAEVWTDTPGGRFLAYGSVVDNRSGDPTYVTVR